MIVVGVQGDLKAILRDLTHVQKTVVPAAQNYAINRTAQSVITRGKRQAAQQLGIAQKHLTPRIRLTRSNFKTLTAVIHTLLAPLKTFKVYGAAGVKRVPGGFVATMSRHDHTGIFVRKPNAKAKKSPVSGQWTQLPIDEARIEVYTQLTRAFDHFMQTFAPGEFKRVFAREMQRRASNAANRRRRGAQRTRRR